MQKYIFIGEGKFENILIQRGQKLNFLMPISSEIMKSKIILNMNFDLFIKTNKVSEKLFFIWNFF
jgi:hypothetical protein